MESYLETTKNVYKNAALTPDVGLCCTTTPVWQLPELSIPKIMLGLLQRFCPDHLYEEIEGDLIQKFEKDVKSFGQRKARRRLFRSPSRRTMPKR